MANDFKRFCVPSVATSNTTSATTYRVRHRTTNSNGASVFGESNHMSSMILMEIGA